MATYGQEKGKAWAKYLATMATLDDVYDEYKKALPEQEWLIKRKKEELLELQNRYISEKERALLNLSKEMTKVSSATKNKEEIGRMKKAQREVMICASGARSRYGIEIKSANEKYSTILSPKEWAKIIDLAFEEYITRTENILNDYYLKTGVIKIYRIPV